MPASFGPFQAILDDSMFPASTSFPATPRPSESAVRNLRETLLAALEARGRSAVYITALLGADDARAHLAACAALLLWRERVPHNLIKALWAAFDRGSVVSPQIAATAFLIDPKFAGEVRAHLTRRDALLNGYLREGKRPAPGEAGSHARGVTALVVLLDRLPEEAEYLAGEYHDGVIAKLLSDDIDAAREVSLAWLEMAVHHLGTRADRHHWARIPKGAFELLNNAQSDS